MEPAPRDGWTSGSAGKVKVGVFSFTEVTDPAAHQAYNRWHQLDHLPEQLPLPGIAAGNRWVCTPECRRARAACAEMLAPVHYVTLYLLTEPVPDTLEEFSALGARLHQEGRFFGPRRAHLSGPFDVVSASVARRVSVSPAAVAFRPTTGVYVLVEDHASAPGGVVAQPDAAAGDWRAPRAEDGELCAVEGVAGVWAFAASPLAGARWRPGRRRVTVCYLDDEPLEVARRLAPSVEARRRRGDGSGLVYAGPFETITPWRWDWFER